MLDVAAHMLLLQRQAQIKHEAPADNSFLPLSLTIACLLRQLPAGLAPPAGILSLHQIDRLPIQILEQKLVRLLYGEEVDALPVRGSAMLARAFELLRALVVYVKTSRAMLAVCHDHLTDQLTTAHAMQSLADVVVATLGLADDEEENAEDARYKQHVVDDPEYDDQAIHERDENDETGRSASDLETSETDGRIRKQNSDPSNRPSRSRRSQSLEKMALPPAPIGPLEPTTSKSRSVSTALAVDPTGIMKRALARDAGDGSAVIGIMRKYPDDARIQTHGVRALKSAIRNFPFEISNQRLGGDSESESDETDPINTQLSDPIETQRREVVQLVLHTMNRYPDQLALQRDALFCLLEYVSHADDNVATIASLGGIAAVMEAMAQLPDDEEAQIAALSVLGHPTLAEESVVRVNPESRRLVLSAMRRFPLSERLQGLACLALANLSLRQDDSMREIVAHGGLELVVAAMNRFSDVSLIQAAGCWLLTTVSAKDDEMLTACLEAGGLPPCERARVRFALDPRVQQHAVLAIQSLEREVADAVGNGHVSHAARVAASPECCVQ